MSNSSWYTGADERYYYGKGAMYECIKKKPIFLWELYFAWRTGKRTKLSFSKRIHWMENGRKGFKALQSFADFTENKSL